MNRDIKLENIMLKSKDPIKPILKVCDFGYSINENHSLPKTAVGTPGYTGMPHSPQPFCLLGTSCSCLVAPCNLCSVSYTTLVHIAWL